MDEITLFLLGLVFAMTSMSVKMVEWEQLLSKKPWKRTKTWTLTCPFTNISRAYRKAYLYGYLYEFSFEIIFFLKPENNIISLDTNPCRQKNNKKNLLGLRMNQLSPLKHSDLLFTG